jgi:predicted P-loop ATPase
MNTLAALSPVLNNDTDVTPNNLEFLTAIFGDDAQWAHVTSFMDDPSNIPGDRRHLCWGGDYASRRALIPNSNQYFTISTFMADDHGKARRRKALFRQTHCLVLDDVREKLDVEAAGRLPKPSWIMETSPGSEQWGYILDVPCIDRNQIDNLNDGLIASELAPDGKDPGQKGVTRYVRLPEGVNTKASRMAANNGEAPRCSMLEWHPDRKVSLEQLAAPFNVDLFAERKEGTIDGAADLPDHPLLEAVHVKSVLSDGRYDITCPWVDDHTGGADDGAAVWTNADLSIGYKCHHGACQERRASDLLDKIQLTGRPNFRRELSQWQNSKKMQGLAEQLGASDNPTPEGFPDVTDNGKALATVDNARHLLQVEGVVARYNEMTKEREFDFPNITFSAHNAGNNAVAHIKSVSAKHGLPPERMVEFAESIADAAPYHPALEWIELEAWDGKPRFDQLLLSLGAEDPEIAMPLPLLRRWMIGGVAALKRRRGVATEGMLTLQGAQGCGKTTWLKGLVGDHRELFRESAIINPGNKDAVKVSLSRWITEAGELDASLGKAGIEELKAFLTRDEDEVRLPYARSESKWPRRTVFCGSVNGAEFLKDRTGNRRFWVVRVTSPRVDEMPDMQQMWAEVMTWYEAGESWYLSKDERRCLDAQNEEFMERCPVEEKILSYFDWDSESRKQRMTVTEICQAVGIEHPRRMDMRAAGVAARKYLRITKARSSSGRMVYDMVLPRSHGHSVKSSFLWLS